jgi:ABC-type uncharacterized transport system ATPase component
MDLTLKLISPITVDGEKISELTLNELTVDENISLSQKHGEKTSIEQDKYFFAMTCRVAPEVIGSLKQRDWTRLRLRYSETLGNVEPESESSE